MAGLSNIAKMAAADLLYVSMEITRLSADSLVAERGLGADTAVR